MQCRRISSYVSMLPPPSFFLSISKPDEISLNTFRFNMHRCHNEFRTSFDNSINNISYE